MFFTDGIHLATDGDTDGLHAFAHAIGLNTKWKIKQDIPTYQILNNRSLLLALELGAKPVPPKTIFSFNSIKVPEEKNDSTSKQDVLTYHAKIIEQLYRQISESLTSQYTKEDFLYLMEILVRYPKMESATILLGLLEAEEDETDYLIWVKRKLLRLDLDYEFVIDFLKLPFTRIPLVITRYGKDGIAFIVLTWRLQIGK